MLNKIRSVILGHAIGDALGVPVEFCSREELKERPIANMQGFGTYPYPAGSWSDDTSMSLCTLDSLAKGIVDYDDIMHNFGKWYYEDDFTPTGEMFDVGNTCSYAIENYFKDKKPINLCGLTNEHSNGNGSLMRIHPIALYLYTRDDLSIDEKIEIIHFTSALTHAHERSKIGCGIYAFVLWEILNEKNKFRSIRGGLSKAWRFYREYKEIIHYDMLFRRIGQLGRHFEDPDNFKPASIDDIKSGGYVVHTLEAAIFCLIYSKSYEDCVLKAVNLGDDTDTVGAVAGGLAGALYGYDSMPQKWLDVLKRKDYIEDMSKRAAEAWSITKR